MQADKVTTAGVHVFLTFVASIAAVSDFLLINSLQVFFRRTERHSADDRAGSFDHAFLIEVRNTGCDGCTLFFGFSNKILHRLIVDGGRGETKDLEQILYDYVGAGYEKPFGPANDDIRLLARTEGIFLDPVYSGKAFHGMMEEIRKGNVPQGSTVVFLHTGGATALFAEPEIIGDLSEEK